MIELPALRSLTIDVMCATSISDRFVVERRLVGEFVARLDGRSGHAIAMLLLGTRISEIVVDQSG